MPGEIKRNTVQRQIVLSTLNRIHRHPTVEDIYAEIQKEQPTISKTTVYRNLRQLAQNNTIMQICLPQDVERYDVNTQSHYHFICNRCGGITDLDIDYFEDIDQIVRTRYSLTIECHDLVFNGIGLCCVTVDVSAI